jgi:hypothetical protein
MILVEEVKEVRMFNSSYLCPPSGDRHLQPSFAESRRLPHDDMERVYEELVEFASSRYEKASPAGDVSSSDESIEQ